MSNIGMLSQMTRGIMPSPTPNSTLLADVLMHTAFNDDFRPLNSAPLLDHSLMKPAREREPVKIFGNRINLQ